MRFESLEVYIYVRIYKTQTTATTHNSHNPQPLPQPQSTVPTPLLHLQALVRLAIAKKLKASGQPKKGDISEVCYLVITPIAQGSRAARGGRYLGGNLVSSRVSTGIVSRSPGKGELSEASDSGSRPLTPTLNSD